MSKPSCPALLVSSVLLEPNHASAAHQPLEVAVQRKVKKQVSELSAPLFSAGKPTQPYLHALRVVRMTDAAALEYE